MKNLSILLLGVFLFLLPLKFASAEKVHGIAMHGTPKYSSNFTHLDYVNPNLLSSQAQNLADKSYSGFLEGAQRGNSENKDKFGFFGFSVVYKIPKKTFCSQINF